LIPPQGTRRRRYGIPWASLPLQGSQGEQQGYTGWPGFSGRSKKADHLFLKSSFSYILSPGFCQKKKVVCFFKPSFFQLRPISSCPILLPTPQFFRRFSTIPCAQSRTIIGGTSAGNGFSLGGTAKFREGGAGSEDVIIWVDKFRPILRRYQRLMMIREGPLRLNPDGNGEDTYSKLGGGKP